jgi:hypothetical protein
MGLLDDAIREHLDLKRRRGADPAEVERAEQDALGPVRRQAPGAEDLAIDQPLAAEDGEELVYEEDLEHEWEEEPYREPLGPDAAAMTQAYEAAPAPDLAEPHWTPADEPEAEQEPPAAPSPAPLAEPSEPERPFPRPHAAPHAGEETAEYEVEFEHQPDKAEDDVLEETPDFLQDAPDHDRLWFEQRPPRDFNFDS